MINGVFKYTFGEPEEITPAKLFLNDAHSRVIPGCEPECDSFEPPIEPARMRFSATKRGALLTLPMEPDEEIFGLGLQLKSVFQRGKKKTLRVNSDPTVDLGDSHAPVPFFVSSRGYGVLVDTARYATFEFGTHVKRGIVTNDTGARAIADNTADLYAGRGYDEGLHTLIEVPAAKGVEIYVFAGPDMLGAVMRYNMFCGGGVLPPMWGLGMWYRAWGEASRADVEKQTAQIRDDRMPVDVFGLEPGWQTHAYSCTYVWNDIKFPNHDEMVEKFSKAGFRTNLWTHLYVHPDSPIYGALEPTSGDYKVWGGVVPDFSLEENRKVFRDYYKKTFLDRGVTGFKIDECDNSDYISFPWSYPEQSEFPSGLDGEQTHMLMGMLSQKALEPAYRENDTRTYNNVRSSGSFASPMPYVLYSDLYDIDDFIRGMVTSGYSGLLWTPEVRQSDSEEELIRRAQTVIFSPQANFNCWMIPNPDWKQYDTDKNRRGEFLDDGGALESKLRNIFELRMELLPYFYSAFAEYMRTGKPPFRALPLDFPADRETYKIDSEYMCGPDLLFAPATHKRKTRSVYLPAGKWFDFFTGEQFDGAKWYEFTPELEKILLFAHENSIIPVAEPMQYVADGSVFKVSLKRFGDGDASCKLFEDDGISFAYERGEYNTITVTYSGGKYKVKREGGYIGARYEIIIP